MTTKKVTVSNPEKVEEPTVEIEDLEAEDLEDIDSVIDLNELDPDLEIWEGGPTVGQAIEWKEEFGDVYITNLTFTKHVMWRTLLRHEYAELTKKIETAIDNGLGQIEASMLNEELVVELCSLAPKFTSKSLQKELAGLPSIISQQILESSGFVSIDVRKI